MIFKTYKKQKLSISKIFILTSLFIFLNILNFNFISASSTSTNSLIEKIGEFNLDDIGEGRPIFMKRINDKIYILTNFENVYIPIQKKFAVITLPRITTFNKLVVLKASTTGFLDKLGEIFLDPNLGSYLLMLMIDIYIC